jgi:type IV secretory pathway VirB10-like protein
MTKRILIITAMLASFAMLPTQGEAQQPPKPQAQPSKPQAQPPKPQPPKPQPPKPQPPQQGAGAPAAPAAEGATPQPVDEATRKRQAALERQKERMREKQEREAQCVIKPVMTDAEIAKCREVRGG